MSTYITLPNVRRRKIPEEFKDNDNRFSESLVEYFLEKYTKKGDIVLDIFAGLGTTLFVAEEMERIPFGVEYSEARYIYIRENLQNKDNIIYGDSLKLLEYNVPKCDFCIASPIYMNKSETENPYTAYTTKGTYKQYLEDTRKIYSNVKKKMKHNSKIVVEVSNLKKDDSVTTLAWDIGKEISKIFHFEGEIVVNWTSNSSENKDGFYGYGYDHSYCLVFSNK
ncbi:MAG: class I SAM-dependent methyltransferase [Asgard group archaeon]|nr:class I SAM-dependent methyltransferase [Asgard group archaeon]